ncbi:hypothetical protein ACLB2K_050445 [Fragaria x ananassa]
MLRWAGQRLTSEITRRPWLSGYNKQTRGLCEPARVVGGLGPQRHRRLISGHLWTRPPLEQTALHRYPKFQVQISSSDWSRHGFTLAPPLSVFDRCGVLCLRRFWGICMRFGDQQQQVLERKRAANLVMQGINQGVEMVVVRNGSKGELKFGLEQNLISLVKCISYMSRTSDQNDMSRTCEDQVGASGYHMFELEK